MNFNANTARFKFYAKGISTINKKELTLDTRNTWEDELTTHIPNWNSKRYLVKRHTSSKNIHEITDQICILTQEYRQNRKMYAVEILEKSWETGWKSRVTSDFERFTNPQQSTSTKATKVEMKDEPVLLRQALSNGMPINLFPEVLYNNTKGEMNQQDFDFDNVSICSEVSQGELECRNLAKTTLVNNLRSVRSSMLQIAQEDLIKFKKDSPNRWAKASSMLPSSFNSVVDLIFLRDN